MSLAPSTPQHPPPAFEARGLRVAVGEGAQRHQALDGIALQLHAGRWTAIVGPNGAGKSTLLRALAGLQPFEGELRLLGRPMRAMPLAERARRLAWIAQRGPDDRGADEMRAADVVMLGRLPHHGWWAGVSAADEAAVRDALQQTGAWALRDRSLGSLSGGERQRVLLARLLAVQADILLMDEPLANLDPAFKSDWLGVVRTQLAAGRTVVTVLHELNEALRADELLVMRQGRMVHQGPPDSEASARALVAVFDRRIELHTLRGRTIALTTGPGEGAARG